MVLHALQHVLNAVDSRIVICGSAKWKKQQRKSERTAKHGQPSSGIYAPIRRQSFGVDKRIVVSGNIRDLT
jgi:hypothetical protein